MSSAGRPLGRQAVPMPALATLLLRFWRRGLHRLREQARAFGPSARLRRILYAFDLRARELPLTTTAVEFRELSRDEIRAQSSQLGAGGRNVGEALTPGSGCVVGHLDGQKVYHAWYVRAAVDAMHGLPQSWRPHGRVLFLHDGYTEPAFRGRGIHTAATHWLLERERGTDVTYAVCVVHADNVVAARAVERVGFRPVARIE